MSENLANILKNSIAPELNIGSLKDKKISSKKLYYDITYYTNPTELSVDTNYSKFIKSIESMFRRSDEYSNYLAYLHDIIGLNHCMILPAIDGDNATLEAHHGPLLGLYDIVSILVEYCINKGKKFNSYRILDMVTKAHYRNEVQIVMLSTTVHQLVTDNKIFIHPNQAFGNFNKFYERYKEGFTEEMKDKIQEYLDLCEKYKSTDNGILKVGDYKSYSIAYSKIKHDLFK